jgi:hypothetical protein
MEATKLSLSDLAIARSLKIQGRLKHRPLD